jgi:hypothetical protein
MGGTCGTYRRRGKYIQESGGKTSERVTSVEI